MTTAPDQTPTELTLETLPVVWAVIAANMQAHSAEWTAALYGAWLAGKLTTDEFTTVLADELTDSVSSAFAAADVVTSTLLDKPALGFVPAPDVVESLGKAATTITADLDTAGDLHPRLERLAVSETVNALQQGSIFAYKQHNVTGYTRGTRAGCCELCTWLKKEHLRAGGYIYPTDQPMHRHPGCTCVPIPVTEPTTERTTP